MINNNVLAQFQTFMQNPAQALIQSKIPQECTSDPNKAIQYLLDSGRITQGQFNAAKAYINQISQPVRR